MYPRKKFVCWICGVEWQDGKGFIEPHKSPCANERYDWNFVVEISENCTKPSGYMLRRAKPIASLETTIGQIAEQARRNERAAVLRFLRSNRDFCRGSPHSKKEADLLHDLAQGIVRGFHIGRPNLEPTSGCARRKGGPFPGV